MYQLFLAAIFIYFFFGLLHEICPGELTSSRLSAR